MICCVLLQVYMGMKGWVEVCMCIYQPPERSEQFPSPLQGLERGKPKFQQEKQAEWVEWQKWEECDKYEKWEKCDKCGDWEKWEK